MNRTHSILILAMVAGTAWAQMPVTAINNAKGAAAQMNKNSAQTNAALPASNSAKSPSHAPVTTPAPASAPQHPPSAAKSEKPAVKKASTVKKSDPATKATNAAVEPAKPENASSASSSSETANSKKRDPFVSPIVSKVGGPTNCAGGKKCLVVDQVALKGVVRSQNGMIAVIVNAANKAYFMRENDPVYNGFVVKITPDSIVFRETVTDRLGKPGSREVVKKVNAPVV
jgi:Tfp pilus assembly protein PilP